MGAGKEVGRVAEMVRGQNLNRKRGGREPRELQESGASCTVDTEENQWKVLPQRVVRRPQAKDPPWCKAVGEAGDVSSAPASGPAINHCVHEHA